MRIRRSLPKSGHASAIRLVAVIAISCIASPCGAQQVGAVAGVVRDSLGIAIRGAEVLLDSASLSVRTDDDGRYRLESVPIGRISLVARRLGFQATTRTVVTRDGLVTQLDFALMPAVQRIAAVVVAEKSEPYDARLAGFNARKDDKKGYFLVRDQLDRGSSRLTDHLRTIPGVRVARTGRGGSFHSVRIRGANCPPLVFVDGFPATSGEFDLDSVDPRVLEGVEIYASMTLVPAELHAPGAMDRCGVIALWSRPAPARRPKPQSGEADPVDLSRLIAAEQVFTAAEVDSTARLVEGEGVPRYPESLWRDGTGGRAVVEFVVSAAGEVEMATFGIISTTHQEFAAAVREAMAIAAFVPATAGGHRVRQVVQMPFEFRIPKTPRQQPDR